MKMKKYIAFVQREQDTFKNQKILDAKTVSSVSVLASNIFGLTKIFQSSNIKSSPNNSSLS